MNFIYSLAHMSLVQILVIGSFFSGIYYFTKYDKGTAVNDDIAKVKQQVEATEKDIRKKEVDLKNMEKFRDSVQIGGSKSVEHLLRYIPNSLTTTTMFSHLTREAKLAGVDIVDKRDEGISDFENFYEILKLRIKCSGSFSQIVLFLSKLTSQDFLLTTDNISMVSAEGERSVEVDMDVYGYRYVEKEAGEDEGEKKKEKEG